MWLECWRDSEEAGLAVAGGAEGKSKWSEVREVAIQSDPAGSLGLCDNLGLTQSREGSLWRPQSNMVSLFIYLFIFTKN
jgi:hypothetical protein